MYKTEIKGMRLTEACNNIKLADQQIFCNKLGHYSCIVHAVHVHHYNMNMAIHVAALLNNAHNGFQYRN